MIKWMVVVLLLSNIHLAIAEYVVSNKNGVVAFSGEHAGMKFTGKFEKWTAQINLPSSVNNNDAGFIIAEFEVRSAKTGDFVYDETLPEGDWFDADSHPKGLFQSTSIVKIENGFEVMGNLSIRGKSLPTQFTLLENGNRLNAAFTINRLEYGIGLDSDPEAEWVSKDIQMSIDIPNH